MQKATSAMCPHGSAAALRNEQFFSLTELNQEIRRKLKKYNEANFERKRVAG